MDRVYKIHSDRLYRFKRYKYYFKTTVQSLRRGVTVRDYLGLVIPSFLISDPPKPHALYLEFSNTCNIKCVYCAYPNYNYEVKFMQADVLEKVIQSLKMTPINKINIGGGEPTLNPHFIEFTNELKHYSRFLNVVTNGQWVDNKISHSLASGAFDMVEVSIDAGDKDDYERSRVGAQYDRLKQNINRLRQIKKATNSKTIIGIRLMIRPSKRKKEKYYLSYWKSFCDTIIAQYITKPLNLPYYEDIYLSTHELNNTYPKCTYPSRAMQIKADGTVPLCCAMGNADASHIITLGNIKQKNLAELWNDTTLVKYRKAHRSRDYENMSVCKGCLGA